jgi:hypothetical protein
VFSATVPAALDHIRRVAEAHPHIRLGRSDIDLVLESLLTLDPGLDSDGDLVQPGGLSLIAEDGAELQIDGDNDRLCLRGTDSGTNFLDHRPVTLDRASRSARTSGTLGTLNHDEFMSLIGGLGTQDILVPGIEHVTGLPVDEWIERWIPAWADHHRTHQESPSS